MNNRWVIVILILTSLLSGLLIYFITRSESIYLNQWLNRVEHGSILLGFQGLILNTQVPGWMIYSLPDGLWMLALTMLILLIWDFEINKKSIIWIAFAIAAGILFEISQRFDIASGTFDIVDLIFILVGALLPVSFIMLNRIKWQAN